MKIPGAKATVDKEWKKLDKGASMAIGYGKEQNEGHPGSTQKKKVHIVTLMDMCHLEIMTHFLTHDPFFLSTVIVEHYKMTHQLASVSRSFQIYDNWWGWLLLAVACCCLLKNRDNEGVCTYFSLLREQWWDQLSRFNGFCDIRRNDGRRNVINVDAETVSPGREVNRRALTENLDQVLGLKTCEGTLFSPSVQSWTASWIGAGSAWFRHQRGRKERRRIRDSEEIAMKHVTTRWLLRKCRLECSPHREPTHVRWWSVARTTKMCVCGAHGEEFCLHPPSCARLWLMSVREVFFSKKTLDWLAKKCAKWLDVSGHLYSFVPFLPSVSVLSLLPLMSFLSFLRLSSGCRRWRWPLRSMNISIIFDCAIVALNSDVRRMVAVVVGHFAGYRNSPSLPSVWPQQVIGLQVWNHLVLTFFQDSFRLCISIRACCGIDLCHVMLQHGPHQQLTDSPVIGNIPLYIRDSIDGGLSAIDAR